MFLQKTSSDTIAIWQPIGTAFVKPIILSTGVGIDNFFNIDSPPINVTQRPSINRNTYAITRQIVVTGSATFHPQSSALTALREIQEYQQKNGIAIYGVGIILNIGMLLQDTYRNFIWTNPYSSPNRNKDASDVTMTFSCAPPQAISLGDLQSIYTSLSGSGII